MNLNPVPFEKMASGNKKIEIRLYDEKRQKINLGDAITFTNTADSSRTLDVIVTGLLRYPTFADLTNDFPMNYFGYPDDYDKKSFIDSIYTIYSVEQEQQFGVLGIKIEQ